MNKEMQDWKPVVSLTGVNLKGMEQVQDINEMIQQAVYKIPLVREYLERAFNFIGMPFHGCVADLGAGTGIVTAALSTISGVSHIYAVEYSRNFVDIVMPAVFSDLGVDQSKVKRIVGDFNKLEFNDDTFNFVFELGAFHHSHDIHQTVRETYRVLKPGGYFIGIDRVHPNRVSDRMIRELVSRQLSVKQKTRYGFNPDDSVTRQDWGEHEYRKREWQGFFEKAGFRVWILQSFLNTGIRGRVKKNLIAPIEKKIIRKGISWVPLPGIKTMSASLIIAKKMG